MMSKMPLMIKKKNSSLLVVRQHGSKESLGEVGQLLSNSCWRTSSSVAYNSCCRTTIVVVGGWHSSLASWQSHDDAQEK